MRLRTSKGILKINILHIDIFPVTMCVYSFIVTDKDKKENGNNHSVEVFYIYVNREPEVPSNQGPGGYLRSYTSTNSKKIF